MRRVAAALAAAAAAALAGAADAGATNECHGLNVCVPVQGPWVLVPESRAVLRPSVQFQLSCPKGYIAGGLDAEVTDPAIDLRFLGAIGAPVNPGITTTRDVVFVGTFVGATPRAPSFRPHIGCMPASGGGGRVPTAVTPGPPGNPTVRHVTNHVVPARRTTRVVAKCAPGERLVGASHAIGFQTYLPPTPALAHSVSATQAIVGGRVVVTARAGAATRGSDVVVQAGALCAGGP